MELVKIVLLLDAETASIFGPLAWEADVSLGGIHTGYAGWPF